MCYEQKCKMLKILLVFSIVFILFFAVLFISINNSSQDKSILVATATSGDNTQEGNAIINFGQNQIVEGDALSHTPGSSEILINRDGIYQISYQLTGVAQNTGTFNFNAIILVNGTPINETLNEGSVLDSDIINKISRNGLKLTERLVFGRCRIWKCTYRYRKFAILVMIDCKI